MLRTAIAMICLALPATADPIPLDELSEYVNAIGTVEARFTQFNDDGSRSRGTLYIKRPGRMKFAYDPPNDALVLAEGGVVAIFDAKSNAEPQQFPLRRTPLNLILGRNIDLSDSRMVYKHGEAENGLTVVGARDPKMPEVGTIELYFSADPIALTNWVITDEAGSTTGIALSEFDQTVEIPNWFFSVQKETNSRQN